MRFIGSILIFIAAWALVSTEARAASRRPASETKVVALTDDEILQLQLQRTLHREGLIQKKQQMNSTNAAAEGQKYYKQALQNYEKGNFTGARKLFESALVLQPESDQIFFDYGKCLYRQGAYKMSLSVFLMLESSDSFVVQSEYYQALNLYHLKNYSVALTKLNAVQEDGSDLAPSAAFFAGQIQFELKNYADAKKSFQIVLDTSKDPKMDAEAEKYIDLAIQQEKLQERLDKKFGYSLNIGINYDGNVLNVAEANSATSLKAYRLSYGGNARYNAVNKANETWGPEVSFSDMYSTNTNFKSDSTIQSTDPFILQFDTPYGLDFLLGKKSSSFHISPGVQMIYMTKDTHRRELVFNNVLLNTSLVVGYSNYFTMSYKLNISREQSYIDEESVDDDQTTQKYDLGISNYYLLSKASSEFLMLDLGYMLSEALGDNVAYKKPYASLGYSRALADSWSSLIKVDYSVSDYDKSSTERKDTLLSGYLGATYSINSNNSIGFGLGYQNNQSTVDFYTYNKVTFSTVYTTSSF